LILTLPIAMFTCVQCQLIADSTLQTKVAFIPSRFSAEVAWSFVQ